MKFIPVKGTRDFYPESMRLRNWITETWRRVSLRNGFEEYDAPIFEYLDLFTVKSGHEIAEQLFSFTDRGGRNLAIRPEITPSLARMINAKINSLPRPVKWFSLPRLCRAENPQKGRLREFFQWNIDIIGVESELADAECILVAVDALREMGLGADDVEVRIGSRPLTMAMLKAAGVPPESFEEVLGVLDNRPKISEKEFQDLATKVGLDGKQIDAIRVFQDVSDIEALEALAKGEKHFSGCQKDVDRISMLWRQLEDFGIADYCGLDMRVVRGLAYYTGIVYEVFGRGESLRAVAGGGRYDNLLELLGGPKIAATGFGMGDVVLEILLREKSCVPDLGRPVDLFVIDGEDGAMPVVTAVVGRLRAAGVAAEFSYKRQGVGKQLKEANRQGARAAAIVRADNVTVKDMATGRQQDRRLDEFLADPLAGLSDRR
ncbi:MAG: histidine--tRNA ligase [Phycisphaerae bacterium]|jgi:histidyl-tRNA synthetase|nr:histidine--tRNA ligase [Phycisphaerae bacterium]